MSLIIFFDSETNYTVPDGVLVSFYSTFDVNLTQVIDSGYIQNSAVNAPYLIAGNTYITTFTGGNAPNGLYYATLPLNTDSAIVTITPPVTGFAPGVTVGPVGAVGPQGSSGYFSPPQLVYDFVVGNYIGENFQIMFLTDISPFVPGSYIQLYNQTLNLSGVWQVVQTRGTYVSPDSAEYVIQNNQLLVAPIDLTNAQYGPGCEVEDVFTANGQTIALYGATSITQNIASLTGVAINNPQNSDILVYKNGSFKNLPYLVYECNAFANTLTASEIIYRNVFTKNVIINGAVGYAGTRPFLSATFNINKNGVLAGTITFLSNGSYSSTITGSNSISLTMNDVIEIVAPASQDLTLGNLAITLVGFLV